MIDTIIIRENRINEAADALKKGQLVVFPTETVYGLGADALNPEAVKKIFVAKGRPTDNPLIVHISCREQLIELVEEITPTAEKLMAIFWPGPLTIVMKKSKIVPDVITGGLDTVAIRMPSHPLAMELIRLSGVPVAAPSANISGKPSPTSERHVIEDLKGRVDYILLGGDTEVGLESTVLDISGTKAQILRPGVITYDDIFNVIGELSYDPHLIDENSTPKSPGMKYKHYSPEAEVIIVKGNKKSVKIQEMIDEYTLEHKKVGLMATDNLLNSFDEVIKCSLGNANSIDDVGNKLFRCLRYLDQLKVDVIISESFDKKGFGIAIMNRLEKAAGFHIIDSEEDER
ncbi:MAG: threonylcarbamoyl-AMP synthase [Clostridiales bacterium]|nr:threonylcarbamoyl-AMP synthase [Clostridiales bacterium]